MSEYDISRRGLLRGIRNALLLEIGLGALGGAVVALWWLL